MFELFDDIGGRVLWEGPSRLDAEMKAHVKGRGRMKAWVAEAIREKMERDLG